MPNVPMDEWYKLCDDMRDATELYNKAQGVVTQKFAAVAQGKGANPSISEMDAVEVAWNRMMKIREQMDAFCEKYAPNG